MASLLLFLRVIVSGNDERLTGAQDEAASTKEQRQLEKWTFPPGRPATARGLRDAGGGAEEEERWLVACLEWPRVDRKSAWMQIV
ncbi:hypothetical protein BAE44_0023811 [Dichanthelium oligosanthes]|uniref:Uncharacterized protein n=1 Tax=Dichanthelium oligosanthes TaxID=888268 RepID=A0A1E5UQM3_9POAL|nr:hypothetical protein BAE44_0023811 [Dichanthelium oligosanthes]